MSATGSAEWRPMTGSGGHPVRRDVRVGRNRRGILDHPLSRMMTSVQDFTQALVTNLGVDADAVVIQINEAPLAHKMKGGKTFVEREAAAKK